MPPAADSGEALRIDGLSDVPLCRPSPCTAASNAALDDIVGRRHIHDLRRTRVGDRTGAADDEHTGVVDGERRVVDSPAVILRAFEHDHPRRKAILIAGSLRYRARNAGLMTESSPPRNRTGCPETTRKPASSISGFVVGPDHLMVETSRIPVILADGFARDGHRAGAEPPGLQQLAHNRGNAAGPVKASPRYRRPAEYSRAAEVVASVSQSLVWSATPACRAIATRCGTQFVDPPMAEVDHDRVLERFPRQNAIGVRSSCTISTIRRPVAYAIFARSP